MRFGSTLAPAFVLSDSALDSVDSLYFRLNAGALARPYDARWGFPIRMGLSERRRAPDHEPVSTGGARQAVVWPPHKVKVSRPDLRTCREIRSLASWLAIGSRVTSPNTVNGRVRCTAGGGNIVCGLMRRVTRSCSGQGTGPDAQPERDRMTLDETLFASA